MTTPTLNLNLAHLPSAGPNFPLTRMSIHCSATRPSAGAITVGTIRRWHTLPVSKGGRGWTDIGYHWVIEESGRIMVGRPLNYAPAAVAGFNTHSIAICYVGGLNARGQPEDTRTPEQRTALAALVKTLARHYGIEKDRILGHRDYSPDKDGDGVVERHEWLKDCPCFDVQAEVKEWLE